MNKRYIIKVNDKEYTSYQEMCSDLGVDFKEFMKVKHENPDMSQWDLLSHFFEHVLVKTIDSSLLVNPRHRRVSRTEEKILYHIFRGQIKVSIDKELVDLYEKNVAPFHAKRAEYLAVSGGLDEKSDKEAVEKEIEAGIIEEVSVYLKKEQVVDLARKKGYI